MTHAVRAIYEHGVFRPTGPVALPEQCEVEFEPRIVNGHPVAADDMDDIYTVLSARFESGERDVAERHDEHQP